MDPSKAKALIFGSLTEISNSEAPSPPPPKGSPVNLDQSHYKDPPCKAVTNRGTAPPSDASKTHMAAAKTGVVSSASTNLTKPASVTNKLEQALKKDDIKALEKISFFPPIGATGKTPEKKSIVDATPEELKQVYQGKCCLFDGATLCTPEEYTNQEIAEIKNSLEKELGKEIQHETASKSDFHKLEKSIKSFIERRVTEKKKTHTKKGTTQRQYTRPNKQLTKNTTQKNVSENKQKIRAPNLPKSLPEKQIDSEAEVKRNQEQKTKKAKEKADVEIRKQDTRTSVTKEEVTKSIHQNEVIRRKNF